MSVLDKATKNDSNAAAGAPSRSSRRETRSSVKTAKGVSKQDDTTGDNNNQQIAASTVNVNITDSTSNKTNGNSRTKTTATSTPAVATAATTVSIAASRSRKSPSVAAVTSIAERLPKGSRAKPLPPKSTTPPATITPSIPTSIYSEHHQQQQPTQAGDKLSQAISLSSSMPSIPSQMEPIDLDEDGDERMTENSAFYLTLTSDDNDNNKSQHPTSGITSNPQQQHQYINDDKDQGAGTGARHGIDLRKKQPSAISVASSKDEYASIIPSVQVERIANWMGGVKEAMKENETIDLDSGTLARHQQGGTTVPTNNINNNNNNTTTEPPIKAETVEDGHAAIGLRKPALRRPPPAPARHVVTHIDASPPLQLQAQAEPVDEVIIPSSLADEEPLQRNYRSGQRKAATNQGSGSKEKRVFVEDSLSSLPPVPLFHEASNVSMNDARRRRSGEESSASTALKAAAAAVVTRQGSRADAGPSSHYHNNPVAAAAQDDLSTIVGGQAPTQDSFVSPMQSLPSFIYETDEEAHARTGGVEMEHIQNDPSLPSELTASCLQELGLKRKNVRDRSHSAGKRHARSRGGYGIRGSNIDGVLEEGDDDAEEDDEDDESEEESGGVALAQRVAFPSSFDLAPMSTLSSSVTTPPLSLEVIEGPRATYTPAGRTGARASKENEAAGSSAHQYQHADPNLASLPSFPSPPASLVFSTMPTVPTLPTFPSILQQEPSLIVLDSQTQQTQETGEEQTQSQEVDY
ncbi:hypothetical protein BGW39_011452 [Mortierella sp. 14UC]|nr:hypothetical protein BGW39_011452 [Mortierella sp. 14UC]